jgi:hypothetical protein
MEPELMTPNFSKQLIAPSLAFDNEIELALSEQGMICGCVIPTSDLFGYRHKASSWWRISELMPELASIKLMHDGQINLCFTFSSDDPSATAPLR